MLLLAAENSLSVFIISFLHAASLFTWLVGHPAIMVTIKRKMKVVGIYNTGLGEYDRKFALINKSTLQHLLKKETDEVVIVYNQFKNAATQILTAESMLPVDIKDIQSQNTGLPTKSGMKKDYLFEPNMEDILTTLIPMTLKTQLYKAILDSAAAEHGARMVAMDKATDNAGELLKSLRLQYNQARQAAITREISEIVGGAAALG